MAMIERIARAIALADSEPDIERFWKTYLPQAQAALEAMISEGAISEAMHLAGRTEMRSSVELYEGEIYFEAFAPDKVFASIIKAAIAER